jgi:Leucine-rich repeat (LRR) protein
MKTKFTLIFLTVISFASITPSIEAQSVNVQDSLALVDLYNSTNGPGWTNHTGWLKGPVKNWFGILTIIDSRVTQIYMPSNNLTGNIPSSLSNLTNLDWLNLYGNHLSGSIPSSLGNFTNMLGFYLANNQLSGSIPHELGNLGINQFATSVQIDLSNNQLTGSIPSEFGNIEFLDELKLSNNQLSGSIPASLGNLVNLYYGLDLSYNQLSGAIPSELGNLVNVYGTFNLSHNQLSGSIPSSFSNFAGYAVIDLSYNQLSGTIPVTLGNNPIYDLYLNNNNLEGNIPASLANILGSVNLSYNQLNGSISPEFGGSHSFYKLDFSHNQLNGNIPPFSASNSINVLYLNDNNLSGRIPVSLGKVIYLTNLNLSHNRLFGNIPASLANQPLTELNLSYNRFGFEGMELIAQTFSFAIYNKQKPIPIHLNNNTLTVFAGGTLANNTYRWYIIGQADSIVIHGDSVFHPSKSGVYYAKVINSVAKHLTLKSDSITYIASPIFSKANTTSFENALQANDKTKMFLVYPNPAKDMLHVQANNLTSFSLIDQKGKILITTNIDGNGKINVSKITAGIYYLKNNSNGDVKRVVITR